MKFLKSKWMMLIGIMTAAFVTGSNAMAQATASQLPILTKEVDGTITFAPAEIASSIQTVVIDSYQYWAVIFLIVIAVGFMIMIFKKKG